MTFTEIALEMADDRAAICRLTAPPRTAHGVLRILDTGKASGRYVSLVSYVGPREGAQELARELGRDRPGADVILVAQDPESSTFRVTLPLDEQNAANAKLFAALRLFDRLSPETLVEPILFRAGRVRARLIVPRHVDNATVHAAVSDAAERGGFRELRVLRIAPLNPERHFEVMRPLLNAEQEVLLRLAVGMGYYANPKRATLDHISTRVGLSISPIHKRLKAAEETLVAAHVGATRAPLPRKRPRRRGSMTHKGGPCEVDFVARAPQHPLSRFVRESHNARVLLHPLSEDPRGGIASWLMVAMAGGGSFDQLTSTLANEQGLVSEPLAREDGHACLRLQGPTERGWGFGAFSSAFGGEAALRRLVFEGEEVYARLVLTAASPVDDLEPRLGKVLAGMGWEDHEVLSVLPGVASRVPSELPEPLSPRQEEVLKVAHALGYYRTPRGCTLEQVASTLGVSANAIHKNLVGAEARIIAHYLVAGF